MENKTIGKLSVLKDEKLVELSNPKDIKKDDIIGAYLAMLEDDNPRIDEIGKRIISFCEKVSIETSYVVPYIKIGDIVKMIFENNSTLKLKNDKDGYLRIIATDNYIKREKMFEKYLSNLPLDVQEYLKKFGSTFVKKNN